MPWKECDPVSERIRFVVRHEQGERMTDLCREFGISRKTGYKILNRWREFGPDGLLDQPRVARRVPHRLPEPVVEAILALKREFPTWGAKKLRAKLPDRYPGIRVPAQSTVHALLEKQGLVKRRRKRRRSQGTGGLKPPAAPNSVWCADFKGQFRLGNGKLCYPLTVTDGFSRYVLACEALEGTSVGPAMRVFELLFKEYGLPEAIRTDNGVPFATTGLKGWSRLSAWWVKLGIRPERIDPGHPEQNGRHERFHLTLKQDTTRPAAENSLQQQERFDRFCRVFNQERPHEALQMLTPSGFYTRSERQLPTQPSRPEYPLHDWAVRVQAHGHANLGGRGKSFYLSSALAGEYVGVRELPGNRWLISFACVDLGIYDMGERTFTPSN